MALNILIAEDNAFTSLQYNRILEKEGHKVVITKDGEECLQKYKDEKKKNMKKSQAEDPFDVVVLDQSMPKKTGKQVANEILKSTPNQRIIFASAYALGSDNSLTENFKDKVEFLQKPFSLKKLVRQIGN
ncbi:chemotaxis response regulator protein-glutamate methylesterase [archaeon MnTg01]|nr:chemotaxis response regulator protein-glutamate methylesterase [archaeon MnTg01]